MQCRLFIFCTILRNPSSISKARSESQNLGDCGDCLGKLHRFLFQVARIQHVSDSHTLPMRLIEALLINSELHDFLHEKSF